LTELAAYFLNGNGCIVNFDVQWVGFLCRCTEGLKLLWEAFKRET
jgi:hypothetical protein